MAKLDENILSYVFYLFIILFILAGVYVVSTYSSNTIFTTIFGSSKTTENSPGHDGTPGEAKYEMVDESTVNCPNVLIRRGNLLLLINTHRPPENGTNPIIFNHLDEYIHYVKVQRETYNNYCPVMFLQEESNAQGKNVYRVRPGPFDQQGGLNSHEMSIGEISDVHDFFHGSPATETTFVDNTSTSVAPGPFNQEFASKTVELDIVTTGQKFLSPSTSDFSGSSIRTPPVSNNNKLSKVENISTENAMNLPIDHDYKESMTGPITNSVQNITSLPPLTESSPKTLPPLTTPPNTPVYQLPMQPQYFNGSLGPYTGSTTNPVSTSDNSQKTVKVVDNSQVDGPYNKGLYPGFDPYGENNGQYTNIDQVHDSTMTQGKLSDNPMDPNWGGVLYTRQQVMSGKYDENQVVKPIYGSSRNVAGIPSLMPNGGPPLYVMNQEQQQGNCSDVKDMKTRSLRSAPESA